MNYKLAKLYDAKGDITKTWYAYFFFKNSEGKMQMIKKKAGINYFKKPKERRKEGEILITEINNLLISGWNPFRPIEQQQNNYSLLSLIQLLREFYEIKKTTLRARSIQHYKHATDILQQFLKEKYTTAMFPDQFTPMMAQEFSDYLLTTKQYKGKSHNNQISNMKTFFNMAIERDIITKNPFKSIKNRPVETGANIAYTDKERKKIKDYLHRNNHPLYIYVQFLYYCGIRPAELMLLQIKHIDFAGKQIQIPAHISKNRKQSSVELPAEFHKLLKEKYSKLHPELFMFSKKLIPGPISVHRNRASAAHKLVLQDLKISNTHTLYSWKHTGAIAAIKSGMNPYSLMRQWRHHSLDQTMIYLQSLGLTTNTEFTSKQPDF